MGAVCRQIGLHNLSGYDAAHVALAGSLDEPLLTSDWRLARVPGCAARSRSSSQAA